jgi:hypothetical protein
VTNIDKPNNGGKRIGITIRNDTEDWSAVQAADSPAVLPQSDGTDANCAINITEK